MNIIEQQIRMHIQKQLMLEAEGGNPSGYDIKIPSSKLVGDLKRYRVERINKQAKEQKCLRGFLIVAKKVREPGDDSLLMGDITRTIAENNTFKQYYNNDYRIVISSPIQRGKRKIYAAWIIDMRTAEPTPFLLLLNKLQKIQSKSVYQQYQEFEKYTIGTTEIIDQSRAIAWTNSIRNYLSYLETEKNALYLKYFGTSDGKLSADGEKQIRSIPDFSGMNRNIVSSETTVDTNIAPKLTLIDADWIEENNFFTEFSGNAIVSTDAVTGIKTLQPVEGTLDVQERGTGRIGSFTGTFKNGAPYDGITEYLGAHQKSFDEFGGIEIFHKDDDITIFDGIYDQQLSVTINPSDGPDAKFTLDKISGKQYYHDNNDDKAYYFDGSFTKNTPSTGFYYERDPGSKDYIAIGQVINGTYSNLAKPVKYPYKGPNDKKTLYQPKDNPDYVYAWFADKNAWGQVLTVMHTKLVNSLITPDIFLKYINYITDPATVTKLSTEFNEGPNYVILKAATPIQVQNDNGDKFTYDPAPDKRGTKLEWTGPKIKRYADNIDWYPTLMTTGGKYLPDQYWISSTDVATEMLNYPFK
jgi:hypothetical protein